MSSSTTISTIQPTGPTADREGVIVDGEHYQAPLSRYLLVASVLVTAANFALLRTTPTLHFDLSGFNNSAVLIAAGLLIFSGTVGVYLYRWKTQRAAEPESLEKLGPYIVHRKLGSGGMGEVYLAEHQLMKRLCAVKLINPDQANNREIRNSFEREAKATAQLTHWNTVEIYDYGTSEDGRFYYVMEYLDGLNLWQYVQQYGPMAPGRVVYILKQICDALYEAGCAGLVHRDIKPSNVFLTERGRSYDVAKLLDFGLVQTVATGPVGFRDVSRKLHGSPSFMCPEQAVGVTPDTRGDLYSLGAVAYFLLTGRPPFVDENPIMLIVAHATTSVPSFEEIGADIPEDLARIIMTCLERDPGDRFRSARELRTALESCECNSTWSWQDAEDWWTNNKAGFNENDEVVKKAEETVITCCDETESEHANVASYDVETEIFEKPDEAVLV